METPLIFVHIGKCGGGSVRARLAAGALNYTKGTKWVESDKAGSYYPVATKVANGAEEVVMEKAYFCNSKHLNYRSSTKEKSYEGTLACNSTTPLGHMIGCPELLMVNFCQPGACEATSSSCRIVYAGHNLLGNEMHYLPYQVSMKWWESTWRHLYRDKSFADFISSHLSNLSPGNTNYCEQSNFSRPVTLRDHNQLYGKCSVPIFNEVDSRARTMAQNLQSYSGVSEYQENWSPIYASLPAQRITMIRDPFDFLLSQYFWQNIGDDFDCNDLKGATTFDSNIEKSNWVNKYSLKFIEYVCGEDCTVRFASAGQDNTSIIAQIKEQAKANLRHSFTVVGLLNETEAFYDMVTTRVGYIDLTLNLDVVGLSHTTSEIATKECKDLYRNDAFQKKMMDASPALAALVEIYNVGVEVNRYQMKELSQCTEGDREARSRISKLMEELAL
eukprot:CAMPEP_0116004586 /NCGR_PEP_ID=MMETSP0321-20121206/681_1 /TAXON_ID=163516 /ORGANISM="Leptocylindrus danicus var. danicus, Strain B650" /LENGTH=444 /DNA_ID=CAMNT_0003472897 /DNA_START=380 /DNA_END=1714 /DNA_ORIENTATION=+